MIFQFSDYRKFLNNYIKQLPKHGFGEAKKMADYLRVSSTFMSQVLKGDKDFSLEQAISVSQYLGLGSMEADYFYYLVQYEKAGSNELKKYLKQKIDELKNKSLDLSKRVLAKHELTENEKSVFYSHPIFSMIHLYCSTDEKGRSLDEIAKRFDLTRARASEIVRFLVETHICVDKNDHYFYGPQSIHLERNSPFLLKHHTNWRLRAISAAENLNEQELMYTVNVGISYEDFKKLREEMVEFIKKFLDKVHPSPSEEIANFNLDWFWIRK